MLLEGKKQDRQTIGSRYNFPIAFAVNLILGIGTCVFLPPAWETNDDAAMAMIANGRGLAAEPSSQLIFSNYIWGQAVRLLTAIFGYVGYSIGAFASITISGTIIYYTLRKSGCMHILCVSVVGLLLFRPWSVPQFTLTAGLTMVASICVLHLFCQRKRLYLLAASCLLAYLSYIIRSQEAFLVLLVALPFILKGEIFGNRATWIAAIVVGLAVLVSSVMDYMSYQTPQWQTFNEVNFARAPYTDFGAGLMLRDRPDIYKAYGFSSNDATLITGWGLYAVPTLANPIILTEMLRKLGLVVFTGGAAQNVMLAINAFKHPYLLYPLAAALLLLVLCRLSWRMIASWAICIATIILLALLGRPAIMRVYYPLLVLLTVAPLLSRPSAFRQYLVSSIVIYCLLANAAHISAVASRSTLIQKDALFDLNLLNGAPLYVWGDQFPFQKVYGPTRDLTNGLDLKIYGFGVFTPAPFSVAAEEVAGGRSFEQQLRSSQGLFMMASSQDLRTLGSYCKEHFVGNLDVQDIGKIADSPLRKVQCVIPTP
ncbi:hypothetical protein [Rhizobium sp. GCM10022189]|uniref:hypothetical protein n=1 Tax=Rhizobium sp. GCM10022189 TaxID=3252654 RepID=UPI00360772C7